MIPARRSPFSGVRSSWGSGLPDDRSGAARPGDGLRLLAAGDPSRPAVVDGSSGETWTYGRLRDEVGRVARLLTDAVGSLVLVHARPDVATLVSVLASLDAGATVLPVDGALPDDEVARLLVRYRPALVVGGSRVPDGYAPAPRDRTIGVLAGRSSFDAVACHPDLGLLVAGRDGLRGPRLVRSSVDAVLAAATATASALEVGRDDVLAAPALHDAGGLAVVHAHLLAGATVLLDPASTGSPASAAALATAGCTTVAGRAGDLGALAAVVAGDRAVDSVRTLVLTGPDLDTDDLRGLWLVADRAGRRLQVLRGGPEAGGCATVLAHEQARTRGASWGRAVPGARIEVLAGGDGLVLVGDQVMMGHAIGGADLVKGDELCGRLFTRVRGWVDGDGFVWPHDATAPTTA